MADNNTASGQATGPSHTPSSLMAASRRAVLRVVGVDRSKDVIKQLELPTKLVQYLTQHFGSSDFYVNRDDVTPEDIDSGVYKAVCVLDNKVYILKTLLNDDIDDPRLFTLRRWEALNQTGIQRCHARFFERGILAYVLEHVRRFDEIVYAAKKHNRRLSEKVLWFVVYHMCMIFEMLQEGEIDVSDFKLTKIVFNAKGEVMIANEILRVMEEVDAMGNLVLDEEKPTAIYTPPEVIRGEEPTSESLVWRLGVTMYEAAALEPAYELYDANNVFEPLNNIMEGNQPQELPAQYSFELKELINQCMSHDKIPRPDLNRIIEIAATKFDPSGQMDIVSLLDLA